MNSSSTSLLLPSSTKHTSKDWESSFGQLASSYGFGGSMPSVPPRSSKSKSTKSSSTSYSSMSSVPSSPVTQSPKDYEKSFGQLSSMYGFGGGVPSLPSKVPKQSKPVLTSSQPTVVRPSGGKDYESSFGQLSSMYGFGGQGQISFTPRK
ncbi:hypothetical protein CPB84DRAFT_1852846 [Gymnopilus junonius]|uniref:Uncharacterized protein n=1 Tax=Gymnopilus junonius TaxID=109634 RepID=A0A9P5N9M2_GYMJU|nr:hypothetical protein CPB84DRAFT_1852846 [Gymnopilus junonius]